MAERLTEDQVQGLLTILKKDTTIDAKVQYVTAIKSSIKQHNVPDTCIALVFEGLRQASASQNAVLVNAGFTALNHLLTRVSRQEPRYLHREAKQTLPLIIERMGDQKDKFRALAIQAMVTMYAHVPADAERFIRNIAMGGKNPRAKESSMQWLLQMHKDHELPFRAYVPTLMELLEDADGMVRDAAKATVIELFREAPNAAKSDLKKQLKSFKVRPAIESAIVKALNPEGTKADPVSRPASAMQVRPKSVMGDRPITPAPPPAETKTEIVEPAYVNTQRELDDHLKGMYGWFEGRETEHNWMKREESVGMLRRLIAGNASTDYPDLLVAGCRTLLDGIIKAVSSLRTSLSKEGCTLVQELAMTFGPGIDPLVELLMQTFIKLSAATKKISSQLANLCVDTIVGKTSYNVRLLQHIWGACQDKNVQPRVYVAGWLKTLLQKEAHHKGHVEHSGGLDLIEKCIKKGLMDPNPGVREKMRSTYWVFATIWEHRAEAIMDSLDSTAQKLLRKDPANPNSTRRSLEPVVARPGMGLSKSTMSTSKPSLRDTMMAQKRALTTKTLPARPGSAMAAVSPVRTAPTPSTTSTTQPATRARPESSAAKTHGGMSVAPMRPAKRRPEVGARPATAGPYSVRTHDGPPAERLSPEGTRSKASNPKTLSGSPKRTVPRARPGHIATASESNINIDTPSKTPVTAAVTPLQPNLPKAKSTIEHAPSHSPSADENLTFLDAPPVENLNESLPLPSPKIIVSSQDRSSHIAQSPPLEVVSPLDPSSVSVPRAPKDENAIAYNMEETVPPKPVQIYEDPFIENKQPAQNGSALPKERSALGNMPVNEDITKSTPVGIDTPSTDSPHFLDNKTRQNSRLLDSGIARVKGQTLDVHGFRKLQSLIRENKLPFADDKFNELLLSLFEYLESQLDGISSQKSQDIKAQVLATIKLLLKTHGENFQPHIARGLEALLRTRSSYAARTHIVAGLELLADELVHLGDADEITMTMIRSLGQIDLDTAGYRGLSMGLHVLKELIESRPTFVPTEREIVGLTGLASKSLESKESGVRMDAVQLCVALHERLGQAKFWESMKTVRDDPKSLITYYIVKHQREASAPC